jgi:sugar/nucleoside kinase (ribokinase family)
MSPETNLDVIGLGHAIVDVLSPADEALLERAGLPKGAMTLIDADRAESIYAEMREPVECCGGSAANTMVGVSSLGGSSAYLGKVRDDALGAIFRRDIRAAGVAFDTDPSVGGLPTGRCLVLVTEDGQRTMATFLGAGATVAPADIDADAVRRASITYLEGYLWDPAPAKEAFLQAAALAHEAGRKVALSLSDPFCVDRHRSEFLELVDEHVDILFANEDEVVSLFRASGFDAAIEALRGRCEVAAVTRGAEGSVVVRGERILRVPAEPVERVVDTTGAGDLYAAGFLHGLARGEEPETCARLGGIAAAEVISHFGARPRRPLTDEVAARGVQR